MRLHPEAHIRGEAHWTRQHRERLLGELNPNSKLVAPDIAAIRSRYAAGEISMYRLAQEYGVSDVHIAYIILRKSWKELP